MYKQKVRKTCNHDPNFYHPDGQWSRAPSASGICRIPPIQRGGNTTPLRTKNKSCPARKLPGSRPLITGGCIVGHQTLRDRRQHECSLCSPRHPLLRLCVNTRRKSDGRKKREWQATQRGRSTLCREYTLCNEERCSKRLPPLLMTKDILPEA